MRLKAVIASRLDDGDLADDEPGEAIQLLRLRKETGLLRRNVRSQSSLEDEQTLRLAITSTNLPNKKGRGEPRPFD